MKLGIKQIVIIFLVALLGGACGTYGIYELTYKNNTDENKEITSEVQYTNNESGVYEKVVAKAIDSVVQITSKAQTNNSFFGSYESTSLGSGVIISEDGYIVTNNHVISGATNVSVELNDGTTYGATIVGSDAKTDLALLKIEASGLKYSRMIDSDELNLGQEVVAIGNSLGEGTSSTNGIISALNRDVTISNYSMNLILTNAQVNNGNSGGGLFDLNGNLVGIVNAKISSSANASATVEGMGYAIPSNTVKEIVEELKTNGYVKNRATLGVKVITDSNYLQYNGYTNAGALVGEVVKGGAADKAGIKAGDLIVAINDTKVASFSELSKLLDDYGIGDTINVTVSRDNQMKTFEVTLVESVVESSEK
ncbi:MAG: trypsin-like peptidase domain-containing protein [Erysipelotrichaceae bacterium]|nr:trypsin-like peptidase domain-containing protein [Erysipelotrichaceae bacterium]